MKKKNWKTKTRKTKNATGWKKSKSVGSKSKKLGRRKQW
tara:strand:+ start:134 stop:250 length:117 start_codon:yes stop_codon:yes gene_type:complete